MSRMQSLTSRIAPTCRIILDNDWAGDPDGLVALAHHLLSRSNSVVAVTSSGLNPMLDPAPDTALRGADLARELIELVGIAVPGPVAAGREIGTPALSSPSAAAEAIVAAVAEPSELPTFLVCAGPLTNVADALRIAPDLAGRVTLVWVGGSLDPDQFEYNRDTDAVAAEFVFGVSELPIWQLPLETYRTLLYSVAELEVDLKAAGPVGDWLHTRFATLPIPESISLGEEWSLGDSAPIALTVFGEAARTMTAADPSGKRLVCTWIDGRVIIADMLAKFRRFRR